MRLSNSACIKNYVFVVVLGVVLCQHVGGAFNAKDFQKAIPGKLVWGVQGREAELPCDVTPPLPKDNVSMVFWFKDTLGMPLYSLDARGGPLARASHLAMSDDLGSRSYFITEDEPSKARLRIQNVNIEDQGVFRCRVDFTNSPTRNFQVNLTLVEQPSAPRVFDAEGREVKPNSSAGTFLEGHELFLSCQVTGGKPKPTLTWWLNDTLLDAVVDSNRASYTTVNQLLITNLPRNFRGGRLECRATSSQLAGDVARDVPFTVLLKPNKVKIVTANDLLSSHKGQSLRCETSGSYPPAKLTWLLDGKPIRNSVVTEDGSDSFTSSILSLNVLPEDDGKDLVCRADNPRFPGGSAEDKRQIHVAFPPRVTVRMDGDVGQPVQEDTEIRMRCEVTARPSPHTYRWYHNGHLIPYNQSGGLLPLDDVLTLQRITQKSAGHYACSATNTEGETYSAPFLLDIQFVPRCKKGYEAVRIGAVPYETINVQCHVEAKPEVTRFSWTYNTSHGVLPVQGARQDNLKDVSSLQFTPTSSDIESLSCWASNSVGRQTTPCVFYIFPAARPESPKSCIIRTTHGDGGLEVSCTAGRDGGLHQSFVLEVSDVSQPVVLPPGVTTLSDQGETAPPLYRVLGEQPQFRLHSLEPEKEYSLVVYAENAKGRSEPPVVLRNIRADIVLFPRQGPSEEDEEFYGRPEESLDVTAHSSPPTEATPSDRHNSPLNSSNTHLTLIVATLTTAAVLLILGIVTAATVIACRRPQVTLRRHNPQRNSTKPLDDLEMSEAGFGEGFQRRSAQYRASMYAEAEARISQLIEAPDLILSPISAPLDDCNF